MSLEKAADAELIAQFSTAGDQAAYEEIVRRHVGMVFRLCRRITGNAHDAEDSTQAVFAILAQRAGELTTHRSLAGWLYSTAWHTASHERRAVSRRRRREQAAATSARASVQQKPVEVERDEFLQELYRALEMLPPDYRTAIVLHHLEGLRIEELAEMTGEPVGTVAARLSRGRAMIRERLARRDTPLTAVNLIIFFGNELRGIDCAPTDPPSMDAVPYSPPSLPVVAPVPPMAACAVTAGGVAQASMALTSTSLASCGSLAGAARVVVGLLQGRAAIAIITLCVISGGASAASPTTRQWIASATNWVRETAVRERTRTPRPVASHVEDASDLADTSPSSGSSYNVIPEPATGAVTMALSACAALWRPSRCRR